MASDFASTSSCFVEQNAGRALDTYFVNVNHDLKNVLAVVRSCCRLLARDKTDGDLRRNCIEAIDLAVDRVTALTRALLVSQPPGPEDKTFDVEAAIRHFRPLLQAGCGGELDVVIGGLQGCPVLVEGARRDFEAALLNLVLNARDASRDGGVVTIAMSRGDADRGAPDGVRISVTDTGRGIAPDNKARVFEPFFTTKPCRRGAGVGLLQVSEFARRSNGRISVSSVPGHGSTFTMHLNQASQL